MDKKFCVCTEQLIMAGGYSMVIIEKFDTYDEAVGCIENGSSELLGFADFYYVKEIWFR